MSDFGLPASPVAPRRERRELSPTNIDEVCITGGFWAARQAVNREVSIPTGYRRLDEEGSLRNLELAAFGGKAEEHRGTQFVDSDVYKWLEAVGWELGRDGGDQSAALRASADQAIAMVQAAQAPDGYLNTWFQLRAPEARLSDLANAHELFCAGHLFEAATAWWLALGDDRLLGVASRFADYLCSVFGPGDRPAVPGHPGVEMALVDLYRSTGNERYVELAELFLDRRGHRLLSGGVHGHRYAQDDVPFRDANEARGHAVMAAYLACGALEVYLETGDQALLRAAVAQWEDMVARRMYVTGGVGSRHKDEAFGDPFELPPDRAYSETCAAVGVIMWSWRLLLITGEARYAEIIERVLLNAFAAGVSLDGSKYFYVNPLQVRAGHVDPEDGIGTAARRAWYEIACCPPNLMRTMARLSQYFVTTKASGVQIWQYAAAKVRVPLEGAPLSLSVDTAYPFNGGVIVRVEEAPPSPVEVALRIPAWCRKATGLVRRGPTEQSAQRLTPGALWRETTVWVPGDAIIIDLPMRVRVTRPDPRIDAVRGSVALERGPVVYCLEEEDAGGPDPLEALRVPSDLDVKIAKLDIVGEVMTSVDAGMVAQGMDDNNGLPYGPALPATRPGRRVQLVPYLAWGNRRPGQTMRVWIPEEVNSNGAVASPRLDDKPVASVPHEPTS